MFGVEEGIPSTLDPARDVEGQTDNVISAKYNDFDYLSWQGNKPASDFQVPSIQESGYCLLVENLSRV